MSEEIEPEVVGEADVVVTEFVAQKIEESLRAAEMCRCRRCRNYYQSWLDWRDEKEEDPAAPVPRALLSPPHSPEGFLGDDDDGPPALDSGNLADWYGKGL